VHLSGIFTPKFYRFSVFTKRLRFPYPLSVTSNIAPIIIRYVSSLKMEAKSPFETFEASKTKKREI
jgi:hypothetical protein